MVANGTAVFDELYTFFFLTAPANCVHCAYFAAFRRQKGAPPNENKNRRTRLCSFNKHPKAGEDTIQLESRKRIEVEPAMKD